MARLLSSAARLVRAYRVHQVGACLVAVRCRQVVLVAPKQLQALQFVLDLGKNQNDQIFAISSFYGKLVYIYKKLFGYVGVDELYPEDASLEQRGHVCLNPIKVWYQTPQLVATEFYSISK